MRKLLLPGLIAMFSIINSASQQKPLLRILEEEDLINNSLNKKEVFIHFETERNAYFSIKIAGKYLPEEHINMCSEKNNIATYRINSINQFLVDGRNELEILVENCGAKSSKKIDINIGSEKIFIDGFEFELCKRAVFEYRNGKDYCRQIAAALTELNSLVPKEYKVTKVFIPYVSTCDCEIEIEKGGTGNAWVNGGRIGIGYGNVKNKVFLKNAIDHEFGHIVYNSLNKWESIKKKIDFEFTYSQIKDNHSHLFALFKDSNYSLEKNAGHPQDKAGELFASAFMIRRNYFEQYKMVYGKLSRNDKEWADDIMDAVEDAVKKQN